MVMQRCRLARAPGHRHDRVATLVVAMDQSAGIVIGRRLVEYRREPYLAGADERAQAVAQLIDDFLDIALSDRVIGHGDQRLRAGDIHGRAVYQSPRRRFTSRARNVISSSFDCMRAPMKLCGSEGVKSSARSRALTSPSARATASRSDPLCGIASRNSASP